MRLKIWTLAENVASNGCRAEHGLSYLISYDTRILFDTGQSDLFLQNAKQLDVDINAIETVVLSHGHYDHANGLAFIKDKKLICHPNVFVKRYSGKDRHSVGIGLTKNELLERFEIEETVEPKWLSEKMVFLGEIPRKIGFERKETCFYLENGASDLLIDDSAIAIILPQGLFIVTGCSHSGICNIIQHAISVTGINKVYGVFGGFHLKQNNKQTQQAIEFLKELKPEIVMPSHCTDLPALSAIYNEFRGEQVRAGIRYTFDDIK